MKGAEGKEGKWEKMKECENGKYTGKGRGFKVEGKGEVEKWKKR